MQVSPTQFAKQPLLLFWETTKACPLACAHCRAEAQMQASASELTTTEGIALLDTIASFGESAPIVVLTGGDPLSRPDIFTLIAHARTLHLRIALAPAVSSHLTDEMCQKLLDAGVKTMSISLDGCTAQTHERVRRRAGHFAETVDAIRRLIGFGFTIQVNTTIMRSNVFELADIAALLRDLGVSIWELFFLVQVGRGLSLQELSASECEDVANFLYEASQYGFIVRTVEAPFFRRVARQRAGAREPDRQWFGALYWKLAGRLFSKLGMPTSASKSVSAHTRDGNGILFVGHDGDVYPAGFLPLSLGNVRNSNLVSLYQDSPLLKKIRASEFTGKCGWCEFRFMCGGSRSRAYAKSGDCLAEDPACCYQPVAAQH